MQVRGCPSLSFFRTFLFFFLDGCFKLLLAAADDHYLGCCCFSPTAHSLLTPLVGYHLSSDPGKDKHRAMGRTLSA